MPSMIRGRRADSAREDWADMPATLSGYPGPVLQITASGELQPMNDDGRWLIDALDRPPAREAASRLLDLIKQAIDDKNTTRDILALPADGGERAIDMTVLPRGERRALVIGLDTTESRATMRADENRYRQLVDIAADFSWETDKDGVFTFVSPGTALGHARDGLIGKQARDILLREPSKAAVLPFSAVAAVRQEEIWVRNADGHPVCLAVSALPILDERGLRCGARGVCHDVTSNRLVDSTDARRRVRDRVVNHILDSIRAQPNSQSMLDTAARAICKAAEADACEAFLFNDDGRASRVAAFGDTGIAERYSYELVKRIDASDLHRATVAGRPAIGMLTVSGGVPTGAFLIWRVEPGADWTDDNELLLVALREQIGVLVSQIVEQRKLETISRFDELTGLINRRFFYEELDQRLAQSIERGRRGALIYVDLDNFKAVNDKLGHDKGDAVLRKLADILRANTREYDLIGRLGGDEFAIWLDDTDANVAAKRGENMLIASQTMSGMSASREKPLAISIGIAIYDPRSEETRDMLIVRADSAMYEAKQKGKGRLALAPPVERFSANRAAN